MANNKKAIINGVTYISRRDATRAYGIPKQEYTNICIKAKQKRIPFDIFLEDYIRINHKTLTNSLYVDTDEWSPIDIQLLHTCVNDGWSNKSIATALNKTERQVHTFRQINRIGGDEYQSPFTEKKMRLFIRTIGRLNEVDIQHLVGLFKVSKDYILRLAREEACVIAI